MTSFPASILDVKAHLFLGAWTDVTSYVYNRDGTSPAVTIVRGRSNESQQQANPSSCSLTLNNRDGRFSMNNPAGAYYGLIQRNTALRVSVPAAANYLRFADDNVSYASTPNSTGLNITGDIDVRLDMNLDNWSPSILASKWTAAQRSWMLLLNADGTLSFIWTATGTTFVVATSTMPVPVGAEVAVRATLAHSTGVVTFYTAPNISGSWTQLGNTAGPGTSTSILSGTAAVVVGCNSAIPVDIPVGGGGAPWAAYNGCQGQVYAFAVLSGIGGTTEASPSFTSQAAGTTSFTDAQSNTWTLNGTSEISGRDYRFHGQVPGFPTRWDTTATDIYVPVAAAGVLRWLGQGSANEMSAMKRAVLASGAPAYWPCEDGAAATQLGSATGGPPLLFTNGTPTLATNTTFTCSSPLPALNLSSWSAAAIPAYPGNGNTLVFRFLLSFPASGEPSNGSIIAFSSSGLGPFIFGVSSGTLVLNYGAGGASTLSTGVTAAGFTGMVSIETGTALSGDVQVTLLAVGATTETQVTAALTGASGLLTGVVTNLLSAFNAVSVGHIFAQTSYTDLMTEFGAALNAHAGETAGTRFARLCSENSIAYRVFGYPANTAAMGGQAVDTLLNLLQECETADRGQIYEPRTAVGLGYRCLNSLCRQPSTPGPAVVLDYGTLKQLAGTLQPVDDDQLTRNDIALTQGNASVTGSLYEVTLDNGTPMSVSPPPAGVGDYQDSETVNVYAGSQLADVAGWILHAGTYPGERYPVLTVFLNRPAIYNVSGLTTQLQSVDIGDYIEVTTPPTFVQPDPIRVLAWGETETLGGYLWGMSFNCVPEVPYETAICADPVYGHADTDGSTLSSATSSATSLTVTTPDSTDLWTTNGGSPWTFTVSGTPILDSYFIVSTAQAASITAGNWFTISAFSGAIFQVTSLSPPSGGFVNVSFTPNTASGVNNPDVVTQVTGDFPFDWNAAGERITVVSITGSSSPQTATVVRSVNGVTKAIAASTPVALFYPPIAALA